MPQVAITETMEQVHKHCTSYLALHKEILEEAQILNLAIRERWGDVDAGEVLRQAEVNSLAAARLKLITDPRTNGLVSTTTQGDLFHEVPLRVPKVLIINGRPVSYDKAGPLDGLEYWRSRQDESKREAETYREAAATRDAHSAQAAAEADRHEEVIRIAIDHGIDPRTLTYAREEA